MATDNDVILGKRGHGRHPGNQFWIQRVRDSLHAYNQANGEAGKKPIAFDIVTAVQDAGGRFLLKEAEDDYAEMTNIEAMFKTMSCFNNVNQRLRQQHNAAAADAAAAAEQDDNAQGHVAAGPNAERLAPAADPVAPIPLPQQHVNAEEQVAAVHNASEIRDNAEEHVALLVHAEIDVTPADDLFTLDPSIGRNLSDEEFGELLSDLVSFNGDTAAISTTDTATIKSSQSDRSKISSALSEAHIKFSQLKNMDKIEFVNDFEVGPGKLYTGPIVDGQPNGRGFMTYTPCAVPTSGEVTSSRVITGDWVKGSLHGQAYIMYENGGHFFGTFSNHKRVGYGVRHKADGSKYVGPYTSDQPNGKGKITYSDGSSEDGDFKNGKLDGFVNRTSSDGVRTVRQYENGKILLEYDLTPKTNKRNGDGDDQNPSKRRKT